MNTFSFSDISGTVERNMHTERRVCNSEPEYIYSHFLFIATKTNEIKKNFINFKYNLLKKKCFINSGIDKDMFQKSGMLHLTVFAFNLTKDSDHERATLALNHSNKNIIE